MTTVDWTRYNFQQDPDGFAAQGPDPDYTEARESGVTEQEIARDRADVTAFWAQLRRTA